MNASKAWAPPDDPDPSRILDEALDDICDGRYEAALSKLVWFHDHALSYEPHLAAVRLSFALGYWTGLAQEYPAALDALYAARDRAATAFRESEFELDHFEDLAALNETLNESARTVDVFESVAETDGDAAKSLYQVAEPYLIEAGEYSLCGRFLDPLKRVACADDHYRMTLQVEGRRPQDDMENSTVARTIFTDRIATLGALLVRNDRAAEARSVFAKALETLDDTAFRAAIEMARRGEFPRTIHRPRMNE